MAANSSSPSNFSLESLLFDCNTSKLTIAINNIFILIRIAIFLPLSILVLYWGHQQWRQKGSFKMMCNTDLFTCHQVAMDLLWVLGAVVYICGFFSGHPNVSSAAYRFSTISFFGQCLFHSLTCVDRYLAVVYPITYLRLRNTQGGRIRNISIGCVWLLSLVGMTSAELDAITDIVLYLLAFTLITISFCNVSVLCVLIRPGPGSGARGRVQVDRSKRRAFYTIVVIMVVVGFWFAWALVTSAVHRSQNSPVSCLMATFSACFSLPGSAVLPLLFLHKAGKLSWCC